MALERSIYCKQILTSEGWVRDALLQLDDQGMLMAVTQGKPASASQCLWGHVIPGMPNLHSHAFQRQMAGLSYAFTDQQDSFWTWRHTMYRLAEQITPRQMQSITAWLQVEMLRAGFTSCGEFHYLHHQARGLPYSDIAEMSARIVAAADSSGMALTLLPVFYCRSGFQDGVVNTQQQRFYNQPERFMDLYQACSKLLAGKPQHRLGLAPHSLRAVSAKQMDEVVSALRSDAACIHIHIAEQPKEVEECQHYLGSRPISWLMDHQEIDRQWCLVHATHADESEISRAAASGAVAGLCPTTEADLGDGFFEIEKWLDAGGDFGIGSDSNLRLSVDEELRWLENEVRLRTGRRNVLARNGWSCGRFLYEKAASGGATAIGQPVGSIQPGYRADLVELDEQHPLLEGKLGDQVLDTLVFAGAPGMIRSVFVAGNKAIDRGRHTREEELLGDFRKIARELAQV